MPQPRLHSHYETLRVDRHATAEQIRSAYRKLAQEYHPDRYQGTGDCAGLMANINAAYGVLSDFSTRVRYDGELAMEERKLDPQPARSARASGVAAARLPRKPFALVFGTAALAVTVSGFAAMSMLAPKRNTLQVMGGAPLAIEVADPMPLVAAQRIQPWVAPAKSVRVVNEATEPVLRLVSEGSMKAPPSRRYETASAQ